MRRSSPFLHTLATALALALFVAELGLPGSLAAKTTDQAGDYSMLPLNVMQGSNITPLVMLNASNDHQLFFKAFSDYSDIDGDGVPDTTYKHSINYYGYFDSYKCYAYDQTWIAPDGYAGRFVPVSFSPSKYCNLKDKIAAETVNTCKKALAADRADGLSPDEQEANYSKCLLGDSGNHRSPYNVTDGWKTLAGKKEQHKEQVKNWEKAEFSGNFLNWATMSRIDAVRKIFFGGHRRVDTKEDTVLERAFLPPDAHSWAKPYQGADLPNLTPFEPRGAYPKFSGWDSQELFGVPTYYCDASALDNQDKIDSSKCSVTDKKELGITLGNTTDVWTGAGDTLPQFSQGRTEPPVVKIVAGNYGLWAAGEGKQLQWRQGRSPQQQLFDNGSKFIADPAGIQGKNGIGKYVPFSAASNTTNANDAGKSGMDAWATGPWWANHIGWGHYVVRVQACKEGLIDDAEVDTVEGRTKEKCKKYPDGNWKPVGLFQEYGDQDQLHFGMAAGSYTKHTKGGVLVRNIGPLKGARHDDDDDDDGDDDDGDDDDGVISIPAEVNVDTDGTFPMVAKFAGGPKDNDEAAGMINAWSLYRPVGWSYGSTGYYDANQSDRCKYLIEESAVTADGRCKNWGNPFAEIYAQSLSYLAGKPLIETFKSDEDANLIPGLPKSATPIDPLKGQQYDCVPITLVNINSSVLSYDADHLDRLNIAAIWGDAVSGKTIVTMTDEVGEKAGLNGKEYFYGETLKADGTYDQGNQYCTAKPLGGTDDDGKALPGLGSVGGLCPEAPRLHGSYRLAGLAHYAHEHDIRRDIKGAQTVNNYGVALASGTPVIEIPEPGGGKSPVTLMPACMMYSSATIYGRCAIVDFQIASQEIDQTAGTVKGSLYVNWEDMEQGGDYDQDMWGMLHYEYNAKAKTVKVSSQVFAQSASPSMAFGYVLSGTTDDGFHAHSGINGYPYSGSSLIPGAPYDADAVGDDGQPTINLYTTNNKGWRCCDSGTCGACLPDKKGGLKSSKTYKVDAGTASNLEDPLYYASKYGGGEFYYAHNPDQLEKSLASVFSSILESANSGTAAASSPSNMRGEGAIYQASYTPVQGSEENKVVWTGSLTSMWSDAAGYTREDCTPPAGYDARKKQLMAQKSNVTCAELLNGADFQCGTGNGQLDDYCIDRVVTSYDTAYGMANVMVWESQSPLRFAAYSLQGVVTSVSGTTATLAPYSMEGRAELATDEGTTQLTLTPYTAEGRVIAYENGIATIELDTVNIAPGESPASWSIGVGGGGSGTIETSIDSTTTTLTDVEIQADSTLAETLEGATADAPVSVTLETTSLSGAPGKTFNIWNVRCLNGTGEAVSRTAVTLTHNPSVTLTLEGDPWDSCEYARISTYNVDPTLVGRANNKWDRWQVRVLNSGVTAMSGSQIVLGNTGPRTFIFEKASVDDAVSEWLKKDDDVLLVNQDISDSQGKTMADINALWDAQKRLAALSETGLTANRAWGANAADGRFIMTWTDENHNGKVDADAEGNAEFRSFQNTDGPAYRLVDGEWRESIRAGLTADGENAWQFLDLGDTDAAKTKAEQVITWIRGVENAELRNRTKNKGADNEMVLRLGDIIDSSPRVVATPVENYDLLYGDSSYRDFRSKYLNRRIMVYAGANDGMLHAFNGGFYQCLAEDVENGGLKECDAGDEPKFTYYSTTPRTGTSAVAHPLGAELWAYAPGNLLPHLRWLSEKTYGGSNHVYYVNGVPRTFDAKIFHDDEDHPSGWGTVMLVGMDRGGAPIDYTHAGQEHTAHSAYLVFDITNPENPPRLLGEIPLPDKSFTTVYPAVSSTRGEGFDKDVFKWYLVFGNGPTTLGARKCDPSTGETCITGYVAETEENATVYLFNLEQLVNPTNPDYTPARTPVGDTDCARRALTGEEIDASFEIVACKLSDGFEKSFIGATSVVDWDLDFTSDAAYLGVVGGQELERDVQTGRVTDASPKPGGGLLKMDFANSTDPTKWKLLKFIETARPVFAQPMAGFDDESNCWVYFGTGRLLSTGDRETYYDNHLYGVKDGHLSNGEWEASGSAYGQQKLVDVSDVDVYTDGSLTGTARVFNSQSPEAALSDLPEMEDFDDLESAIGSRDGWRRYLPYIHNGCGADVEDENCYTPSTRNLTRSVLGGGVLFSTVYEPPVDICQGEGASRLYALYYKTGTAYPDPIIGIKLVNVSRIPGQPGETKKLSLTYVELGSGMASGVGIRSTNDGENGGSGMSALNQVGPYSIATEVNPTVNIGSGRLSWEEIAEDFGDASSGDDTGGDTGENDDVWDGWDGYDEGDDLNMPKP